LPSVSQYNHNMELRPSTMNPFTSVRIRPGAMPFLFRDGESAAALVKRLRASHWCGQVIGPHGTGKSTLVESLLPLVAAQGKQIVRVPLPGRDQDAARSGPVTPATVLVIDGFEQFGPLQRWAWRWYCWWRGCGLLVTAHRDLGLPTLTTTAVDEALAQRVVASLLPREETRITPNDVSQALRAHQGNLRDALFALYDIYEERRVARPAHQVSQR
jgi:hypothetical protein